MSRPAANFPAITQSPLQEISDLQDVNGTDIQIADVALSATYSNSGGITITASGTPFTNWQSYGAVQNLTTGEIMFYLSRTNSTLTVISANRGLGGTTPTAGNVGNLMRFIEPRICGALLNRICVELEAIVKALKGVVPCTAGPVTVLASDAFKTFTNEGASGLIIFQLPAAAVGLRYRFLCQNSNGIQIQPNNATADIIYVVDDQTSAGNAGGYMQTANRGALIELECIGAGEWYCTQVIGSWPTFN